LRDTDLAAAFDAAAPTYDTLVDRNPGYHDHLRLSASRLGLTGDGAGLRLLDAGCGTGASTAALLSVAPRAEIVGVDAAGAMLGTRPCRAGNAASSTPSSPPGVNARSATRKPAPRRRGRHAAAARRHGAVAQRAAFDDAPAFATKGQRAERSA
jgi:SAM-dependent methyltransferase